MKCGYRLNYYQTPKAEREQERERASPIRKYRKCLQQSRPSPLDIFTYSDRISCIFGNNSQPKQTQICQCAKGEREGVLVDRGRQQALISKRQVQRLHYSCAKNKRNILPLSLSVHIQRTAAVNLISSFSLSLFLSLCDFNARTFRKKRIKFENFAKQFCLFSLLNQKCNKRPTQTESKNIQRGTV